MSYNREQKLKKRYGMSSEEFEHIKVSQGGGCAVCGKEDRLVVDHCHSEGHVRGLLCHQCNIALGMVKDDTNTLRRMVGYLNNTRARA